MSPTPKNKKTDTPREAPAFIRFFSKKETRIVLGIVLTGLVAYLSVVMLSFIFTGSSDFSKVNNRTIFDLGSQPGEIRNIGAAIGAWTANAIINGWFGLPSFFVLVFGWFCALRLLGIGKTSLIKVFFLCTPGLLWFSLALAFFFKPLYENSFLMWGGKLGFNMSQWLMVRIGWPGIVIVLFSSLLIFLVIARLTKLPFFLKRKEKADNAADIDTEEFLPNDGTSR